MEYIRQLCQAYPAPSWQVQALTVPSIAILAFVLYYVYLHYFSALAGIPGPKEAIVSRFWMYWRSRQGDMHKVLPKLHAKYGKLVRIAPDELSVADLDAIREIYGMFDNCCLRHSLLTIARPRLQIP